MNKLMRKLSISILAVVFAVIAMGATTFAWFTLTNTAKVEPFDMNITGGEGVEISLDDGASWSSIISATDFVTLVKAQQTIGTMPYLNAVTTENGYSGFKLIENIASTGVVTYKPVDAVKNVDYLEFKIMVRTANEGKAIYLSNSNTDITGTAFEWVADRTFIPVTGTSVNAGGTHSVNPADAARISFDNGASQYVFQAESSSTNTVVTSFDWEFGALNYYAISKNIDASTATAPTVTLPTAIQLGSPYTANPIVTTTNLSDGYATATITVHIWLEGWDTECYNSILGRLFSVEIGFTTLTSAA